MNAPFQAPEADRKLRFRRFGPDGPPYEILRDDGGSRVRVRVLESGEELDYPRERASIDPPA